MQDEDVNIDWFENKINWETVTVNDLRLHLPAPGEWVELNEDGKCRTSYSAQIMRETGQSIGPPIWRKRQESPLRVPVDTYGLRLLHQACRHRCALDIIEYVYRTDPLAIRTRTRNGEGYLPIDFVCDSQFGPICGLDVVQFLVDTYPDGLRDAPRNNLPLHTLFASEGDIPVDVAKYIIDIYPQALLVQDGSNNTPLHWVACMDQPIRLSEEIIRHALETVPSTIFALIQSCDEDDYTLANFRMLVSIFPDILNARDDKGYLPLHTVCECGSFWSLEYYQCFDDRAVTLLNDSDNEEQRLPLHVAAKNGSSFQILLNLARSFPDALYRKDSTHKTPLELLQDDYSVTRQKLEGATELIEREYALESELDDLNTSDENLQDLLDGRTQIVHVQCLVVLVDWMTSRRNRLKRELRIASTMLELASEG